MTEFLTSGEWWLWFHAVFAFAAVVTSDKCRDVVVGSVGCLLLIDWGLTNLLWWNATAALLLWVDMAIMLWVGFLAADSGSRAIGWVLKLYVVSVVAHLTLPAFVSSGVHLAVVNTLFDVQCLIIIGKSLRDNVGAYRFPWWHDRTNRIF